METSSQTISREACCKVYGVATCTNVYACAITRSGIGINEIFGSCNSSWICSRSADIKCSYFRQDPFIRGVFCTDGECMKTGSQRCSWNGCSEVDYIT